MKTCKKLLAITIALVLLVSTLVSGLVVSAADATTTLAIGTTTIKEGTTTADVEFVLTFAAPTKTPHSLCTITAADGLTLTAIKVDQAKTKYVKQGEDGQWVDDELITDEEAKVTIDNDGKNLAAGKVLVESAADSKAPTVTFITFVATFAVAEGLAEGTYAVSAEADATNWAEDDIAVTVTAGAVVVEAAHVCEAGKPVDNGDGTHDVPCTGCDVLIKDNEAHNFVEGACSVCGAKEPSQGCTTHIIGEISSAKPATSTEPGKIYGTCSVCGEECDADVEYYANIKTAYTAAELAGETSILFSARNDRLAEKGEYEKAFIYIQHTISGDGTNRITIKDISEATDTKQGSQNRPSKTWKYGVKSLQYTEVVSNNVFVYAGEKWYSGDMTTYSLRSYIDERLSLTSDSKEKALYANLLSFGAEMQKIKGYNLENLATDGLSEDILALITEGSATMTDTVVEDKPADNNCVYINKYGFDMADKIVAMMYFRSDRYSGENKDDYKVVASWQNAKGIDKEIIIRKDGSAEVADMYYGPEMQNGAPRENRYTFNFDQLASYDFRQKVTFKIYDGENLLSTYTASYEALVKGSIDSGTFTGSWVTVSNKLLHYSDAAKAYFCQ